MSTYSRKDFLRLTSWGILATLLPTSKFEAFSQIIWDKNEKTGSVGDFESAQVFAAKAREKFLMKDFSGAESDYREAINLAPAAIQFYDGLDNVFGAQYRYLQSIDMYRQALAANPGKIEFYDRAARSLFRLETGNHPLAAEFRSQTGSSSLLLDARTLYEQAISIKSKGFLLIGLAKVNARINIAPLEPNFKVNRVFKNLHSQHRNEYKVRINQKSDQEIQDCIDRIDLKKRADLYSAEDIERREINMLLQKKKFLDILQNRKNITDPSKISEVEKLFTADPKDPSSLKKAKIVYYSNNKFIEFVELRRMFVDANKNFYGYLGLMDAMELAYKKQQASISLLDEALEIGASLLQTWTLVDKVRIDLVIKIIKIHLLKNDYSRANELAQNTLQNIKIVTPSIVNKLVHQYAKIYYNARDFQIAKAALLLGAGELSPQDIETTLVKYPQLQIVSDRVTDRKYAASFKDNINLYYLLYQTYFNLGETSNYQELMERLIANNPTDPFVLTRS